MQGYRRIRHEAQRMSLRSSSQARSLPRILHVGLLGAALLFMTAIIVAPLWEVEMAKPKLAAPTLLPSGATEGEPA